MLRLDGYEVIPFWSSRSHVEKVRNGHPKYHAYSIKAMTLRSFMRWLPELRKQGMRVGTNWAGKRLKGYDVRCGDLFQGLQYWIKKSLS